jgi:hypothetical protein
MEIRKLCNGDLVMRADKLERMEIRDILRYSSSVITAEAYFIMGYLEQEGYRQIGPEEIGALTSAPIITNGIHCWGFMRYQVDNFLEELAKGREVQWQKG